MQIGRFQIDALIDGRIVAEPSFVYPTIAAERWAPHADLLSSDGRIVNEVGAFLIRDGEQAILVDNGVGPDPSPPFTGGNLLSELVRIGLEPTDVTTMLFTHLHFDHIGWTTRDGAVTFENARHVAHRDDWEYFFSGRYLGVPLERPGDFPVRRLAPLLGGVDLWEGDSAEIVPGITVHRAEGHTPGHAVVEIVSRGERGVLIGDLAHHQVELLEDDWSGVGDTDAVGARRSTMHWVEKLVSSGVPFAAPHFPGLVWGRLEQAGPVRRWISLQPERSHAALAMA